MKEFVESREGLLAQFCTDSSVGLTIEQAEQNQEKYGGNTLTREKPKSLVRRIFEAATEPMILMLIMAGIVDIVVNVIRVATGGEADFLECVGIFVAISLSVVITVVMEGKSAKAFEALSQIGEDTSVKVLRRGETILLSQKRACRGGHCAALYRG